MSPRTRRKRLFPRSLGRPAAPPLQKPPSAGGGAATGRTCAAEGTARRTKGATQRQSALSAISTFFRLSFFLHFLSVSLVLRRFPPRGRLPLPVRCAARRAMRARRLGVRLPFGVCSVCAAWRGEEISGKVRAVAEGRNEQGAAAALLSPRVRIAARRRLERLRVAPTVRVQGLPRRCGASVPAFCNAAAGGNLWCGVHLQFLQT